MRSLPGSLFSACAVAHVEHTVPPVQGPATTRRCLDARAGRPERAAVCSVVDPLALLQVALLGLVEEHQMMIANPNRPYSHRFLKLRRAFFKVMHSAKHSARKRSLEELLPPGSCPPPRAR
jgi:hypothetical protein